MKRTLPKSLPKVDRNRSDAKISTHDINVVETTCSVVNIGIDAALLQSNLTRIRISSISFNEPILTFRSGSRFDSSGGIASFALVSSLILRFRAASSLRATTARHLDSLGLPMQVVLFVCAITQTALFFMAYCFRLHFRYTFPTDSVCWDNGHNPPRPILTSPRPVYQAKWLIIILARHFS